MIIVDIEYVEDFIQTHTRNGRCSGDMAQCIASLSRYRASGEGVVALTRSDARQWHAVLISLGDKKARSFARLLASRMGEEAQ